jgi:sugar phosphate isomerase/epimerase
VARKTLLANLDRLTGLAAARGVRAVLHPHVGTMVERGDEVRRVLEGSAISLCLDTGHLLIGGTDPAELTRQAPDRIAHTQDTILTGEPRDEGPVADVRHSAGYLRTLLTAGR